MPTDYVTIGLTAVAAGAATQTAAYLKDRLVWGREGKFAALYAALFFEAYADECSRYSGELQAVDASEGHAGAEHTAVPPLPPFPNDIVWQRVGIRMTEAAYGFRVMVDFADKYIASAYDFDPPDGGDAEVRTRCVSLGLAALDVAARIRKSARIGDAPVPNPEYTTRVYLEERQAEFDERAKRHLAAQEAARAKLLQAKLDNEPSD